LVQSDFPNHSTLWVEYTVPSFNPSRPNYPRDFLQEKPFFSRTGQLEECIDFLWCQIPLVFIQFPSEIFSPRLSQQRVIKELLEGAAFNFPDASLGHIQKQSNFFLR